MKNYLIICCFLFSSTIFYAQGKIDGFYRGKGNVSVVLGLGFEDGRDYFAGTEKTGLSRSLYYANLYGAYGITNDFDVSFSLPYMTSNKNSDFQDMALFLKYRVYKTELGNGKLQFSLAAGFSTPVGNYTTGGLNDLGQRATIIESRGVIHYHWNTGWFATLQSGYSFKFEPTPNSIPVTFKAGRTLSRWYYDIYYDYQHSFGGIDYLGTPPPQDFREFGVDFHKVGGTLYRSFNSNWGAYVSLSYLLSGRNTFQGPGYGVGLVYNFKTN